MNRQCPSPGADAFSMVEVALSLAILAVGMVGVLALLPVGLEGARQVHAETVASQVVRGAIADFATNAYATIAGVPSGGTYTVQYFNQEGQSVPAAESYFRLTYVKGSGDLTTPSCRYFLTLAWPNAALQANPNSRMAQSRTFVTEVMRN
jgi:uncharacterized protein (TIGR02598 family)